MELRTTFHPLEHVKDESLIIGLYEDSDLFHCKRVDQKLENEISTAFKKKKFTGEFLQVMVIPTLKKLAANNVILVGLGKEKNFTAMHLKKAAAISARAARELGESASTQLSQLRLEKHSKEEVGFAITEGALLGLYKFDKYKTGNKKNKKELKKLTLVTDSASETKKGMVRAQKLAKAVYLARDLVNEPPSILNSVELADRAKKMAKSCKLKVKVWDKKQIQKAGMGGLLAVNRGSAVEPRFIVMEKPGKGKPICIVGKGITFDAGGLGIKPSKSMVDMKIDMGGAAAVIGTMMAVATMNVKAHVIGIVPTTDNMLGANAYKPGDIIKTFNGKTIEVLHTDAEGRIILADALGYAAKLKPKCIIDLATLTGACSVALGDEASGLMGNNQDLIDQLKSAGEKADDRAWQLPLWDWHRDQVKGELADVKNLGNPRGLAGAITAGAFLENFVGDNKWAHLDIAGPASIEEDKIIHPKGGTGAGVRLLVKFFEGLQK